MYRTRGENNLNDRKWKPFIWILFINITLMASSCTKLATVYGDSILVHLMWTLFKKNSLKALIKYEEKANNTNTDALQWPMFSSIIKILWEMKQDLVKGRLLIYIIDVCRSFESPTVTYTRPLVSEKTQTHPWASRMWYVRSVDHLNC